MQLAPFLSQAAFIRSCMDKEGIERMGVEPLKHILRHLGGWPALEGDKWQAEEGYVWYEQVSSLEREKVEVFLFPFLPLLSSASSPFKRESGTSSAPLLPSLRWMKRPLIKARALPRVIRRENNQMRQLFPPLNGGIIIAWRSVQKALHVKTARVAKAPRGIKKGDGKKRQLSFLIDNCP